MKTENANFVHQAMKINESSTSRLHSKLSSKDSIFAIISPYQSEYDSPDNQKRMIQLKSDVRKLGLGFNHFVSRWVEDGESFDEESLLISSIDYKTAIKLGVKYNQSSIIYKDKNSLNEICTTEFETYKPGDVVRTFNTGKDMMNIKNAEDIFSRRKSGPASMPKKGSNKKPFSLSVKENFELYQVYDPKPSYFQTEPIMEKLY